MRSLSCFKTPNDFETLLILKVLDTEIKQTHFDRMVPEVAAVVDGPGLRGHLTAQGGFRRVPTGKQRSTATAEKFPLGFRISPSEFWGDACEFPIWKIKRENLKIGLKFLRQILRQIGKGKVPIL